MKAPFIMCNIGFCFNRESVAGRKSVNKNLSQHFVIYQPILRGLLNVAVIQ